jgi:thymidylate synthase
LAHLIQIEDNHTGYRDIIKYLMENGEEQDSRNGKTIELEDVVIEVDNPKITAGSGVRKFYSPEIGLVEGLQLISGVSDSALTAQIQPNFRNYMEDDTGKFWGAYGPRIVDQLPIIVERLREDPDTRQAVITLWNPEFDAKGGKKDHPCTSLFNFRIRNGALNMSTFMRSNDAIHGWPFDLVQFSMLQQTIARELGVATGRYSHHVGSFHIYEPHWGVAQEIINEVHGIGGPYLIPRFKANEGQTFQERAFETYRVVTQTLPWENLKTTDEKEVAQKLLDKRQAQLKRFMGTIDDEA